MRVGVFADSHDHLDNIRRVVRLFNEREVECVLFAGDLVSTFAVPPLRDLKSPFFGCFGDNEGNRIGIVGGLKIIGEIQQPPASCTLADGTRVVMVHMERQLTGYDQPFDVCVYGHTHRPRVRRDDEGRLYINPGETSGWTFGRPTAAILETSTLEAEIVPLSTAEPLEPWFDARRRRRG